MKTIKLLACFLILSGSAFSQSKKIKTFAVQGEIVKCAVDRAGDFYIIQKNGEIQKFDRDGNTIGAFKNHVVPTIFDPTNALRLLLYNQGRQEYAWLSPDLSENPFQALDASLAIEPALLCPSGDLNLWVFDRSDFSLRRFNPKDLKILSEFSIRNQFTDKTDFTLMREYQNFLFLLDPQTGIHIYNYLGKQIKQIEVKNLTYFNFLGEELYYLQDGSIKFVDLFTAETREMPLQTPAKFVLLTDERFVTIDNNQVSIYEYRP